MEIIVTISLYIEMGDVSEEQALAEAKQLDDAELWELAFATEHTYEANPQD